MTKKSSSDLNKSVIYAEKGGNVYSLTDELSVWVFEITRDTLYNLSNLHWYSGLKFRCNSKDRVGKTEIKSSEFHGLYLKRKKNSIIGKNVNFFMYFTLASVRVKFVSISPFSPAHPPKFYLLKQWASWPPDILTSLQVLLAEPFLSLRFPVYSSIWGEVQTDPLAWYSRVLNHCMKFMVS